MNGNEMSQEAGTQELNSQLKETFLSNLKLILGEEHKIEVHIAFEQHYATNNTDLREN